MSPVRRPSFHASPFNWCPVGLAITIAAAGTLGSSVARAAEVASWVRVETAAVADGPLVGEVLLKAADGGLMVADVAGGHHILQPEQIVETSVVDPPDRNDAAVVECVTRQLPAEFVIRTGGDYVIAGDLADDDADRVATLLQRVHRAFFTYWDNQGIEVRPPEVPLVAVALKGRASFRRYAGGDIGDQAEQLLGYYHLESNRLVIHAIGNRERDVSTIIHEAVHQLAFNSGLQNRLADNPKWMSEGLAMFFESPDRRNPDRWRSVGGVNPVNLRRLWAYSRRRPEDSLLSLIADDGRFDSPSTAADAYGEAWALTYFLMRTRSDDYRAYLAEIADGPPLARSTRRERIETFERHFGPDLSRLDASFVRYMSKVRVR